MESIPKTVTVSTLRDAVSRWGELLRCSKCGTLVESLNDLSSDPGLTQCRKCYPTFQDHNSLAHLTRVDLSKILRILRLLLHKYEQEQTLPWEDDGPTTLQQQQQQPFRTKQYNSLNQHFLPEVLDPALLPQCEDGITARNPKGGQVYYGKRKRRKRSDCPIASTLEQNTDQFEFDGGICNYSKAGIQQKAQSQPRVATATALCSTIHDQPVDWSPSSKGDTKYLQTKATFNDSAMSIDSSMLPQTADFDNQQYQPIHLRSSSSLPAAALGETSKLSEDYDKSVDSIILPQTGDFLLIGKSSNQVGSSTELGMKTASLSSGVEQDHTEGDREKLAEYSLPQDTLEFRDDYRTSIDSNLLPQTEDFGKVARPCSTSYDKSPGNIAEVSIQQTQPESALVLSPILMNNSSKQMGNSFERSPSRTTVHANASNFVDGRRSRSEFVESKCRAQSTLHHYRQSSEVVAYPVVTPANQSKTKIVNKDLSTFELPPGHEETVDGCLSITQECRKRNKITPLHKGKGAHHHLLDEGSVQGHKVHLVNHWEWKVLPFLKSSDVKERAENQQEEKLVAICFRTFSYLKARALGFSIITTRSERAQNDDSFRIWGDSILYDQVVSKSNKDTWLHSTTWWKNSGMASPCLSSVERVLRGQKLLANFEFIIIDDGLKKTRESSLVPRMSLCQDETALKLEENKAYFQGLSSDEVTTLCKILGSNLLNSVFDARSECIILVPDRLDEEFFSFEIYPKLLKKKIIPGTRMLYTDCTLPTYQKSNVKFLYFSWLADTVSADQIAPLFPHCLGYLG